MKKLLATILALVMALGVTTISWADENNYVTIDGLVDENGLIHYEMLTAAAKAWRESKNIVTSDGNFGSHPAELTEVESIVWTIHGTVDTGNGEGVIGSVNAAILSGGYIYPAVSIKKIVVKGEDNATITDSISAGKGNGFTYIGGSGADVTIEHVAFPAYAYANSQCKSITFNNCKFEKGLKILQAAEVSVTNNTFTNDGTTDPALFVQNCTAEIKISGNNISGYMRGMNIQAGNDAVVTIDNNTISDLTDANKGPAIQLTSGKTFTVTNNTISNAPANAFRIYENCPAESITINNNTISAKYLCWNQGYDMSKVSSADNTCSIEVPGACAVGGNEIAQSDFTINVKTVTPPRYYYSSTTTDTKTDTTKGSPKTFDAGIGIYAVTAVLSVTGMAWTAKKRH
ncbi:MAG: right-handed parallel beta-helix repeat-containing protein [Clostridiales bacterium]|nr:right-handed parallel beta-helix repeat-containing protein [Clostridiales bacterium]